MDPPAQLCDPGGPSASLRLGVLSRKGVRTELLWRPLWGSVGTPAQGASEGPPAEVTGGRGAEAAGRWWQVLPAPQGEPR